MNEQDIQKHLEKIINDGKEKIKSEIKLSVDEVISDIYTDILPHALHDTEMNIGFRTADAVENLIRGNFEFDSDYLIIPCSYNGRSSVRVRVKMTACQYDNLRKSLIEVMPQCPKDLEIEYLREELNRSYKRY